MLRHWGVLWIVDIQSGRSLQGDAAVVRLDLVSSASSELPEPFDVSAIVLAAVPRSEGRLVGLVVGLNGPWRDAGGWVVLSIGRR
jgi:hypothetical protein